MVHVSCKSFFLTLIILGASLRADNPLSTNPTKKSPTQFLAATIATIVGTECLLTGACGIAARFAGKDVQEGLVQVLGENGLKHLKMGAWFAAPGTLLMFGSIAYLMASSKGVRAKIKSLWGSLNSMYGSLKMFIGAAGAIGMLAIAKKENHLDDPLVMIVLSGLCYEGIEGLLSLVNGYCLQPDDKLSEI